MEKKRILSIDCGTQSVRAMVFDSKGNLIEKVQRKIDPYFSKKPGWAEQYPELYWKNACLAMHTLKENNPEEWEKIEAVVVTTSRATQVLLDKNGNVIRPSILWLDQRKAKCKKSLRFSDKIFFSLISMKRTVEIIRRQSPANWIKENEPEVWDKTYKYMLISGFFNYKLTGKFVDSVASQIGFLPFDYKNRRWEKSKNSWKWYVFGVGKEKLYDLVEAGSIIGETTKKAAEETGLREGLPVVAGGSDKGCETLGNGCIDPSSASVSFGTTTTVQITSPTYIEPLKFMPAYPSVIPSNYNPEIEVFRGYWMIRWFKKEFAPKEVEEAGKKHISAENLLDQRLKEIPAGSQGLVLQPYWGPHVKMPDAKGSIIGFGDVHTRMHIYRAIVEGINYALMDGLEKIEKKSKLKVQKIMVAGGGAQSDAICQITADMFNRPVYRINTHEVSGLGAAIIGFVGIGVYKNYKEAIKNMVHYKDIFNSNSKNSGIYKKLYKDVYKKIYPSLKNVYKSIRRITNYPEM